MLDALLLWLGAIAIGFVLLNQGAKFLTDNATRIAGRCTRTAMTAARMPTSRTAPTLCVNVRCGP